MQIRSLSDARQVQQNWQVRHPERRKLGRVRMYLAAEERGDGDGRNGERQVVRFLDRVPYTEDGNADDEVFSSGTFRFGRW